MTDPSHNDKAPEDVILGMREALIDLADAARSACDARQHPPLTEALAEADYWIKRFL